MYARPARGNGHRLTRFGTEHFPCRRDELREHEGGGGRRGGLEMLARGREGALQRTGEGEAAQACFEGLQPPPVILARKWPRREQALRQPHDQPQSEQAVALGSADGLGHESDEALLSRRGGGDHATRRLTAAATSAGMMSARQR